MLNKGDKMKKFKHLFIFLIAIVLVFSLVACNTQKEDLDNARKECIDSLSYDKTLYNEDDIVELDKIISKYVKEINNANIESLDTLKNEAISKMSKFDTKQTKNLKTSTITSLNSYLNLEEYYKNEIDEINNLISKYTTLINEGNNKTEYSSILKMQKMN